MWKNKKKGFSLIELIIAVTILAVLAAMLVPALLSSNGTTRENADEADIESLATTIQMAAQTNKIYKNGRLLASQSDNDTIKMVFAPNDNYELACVECYIVNENGKINEVGSDETNVRLLQLKQQITDYVNGIIEPTILSSDYYRIQKFIFSLEYPDVDLKVNVSWQIEEVGMDDIFNWPDEDPKWEDLYPNFGDDEGEEGDPEGGGDGETPAQPNDPTEPEDTRLEIAEVLITKDNRTKFGFKGTDNEACELTGSYVQGRTKYVAIGIDTEAFADCTKLKSITIPNTIASIRDGAFKGCTNLENISISSSVLEIGNECFKGSGLKSIIIPNTVVKLGSQVFENCASLKTADISDSVFRLGDSMFRNCTNLSSITLPNELREIGNNAFRGCSVLGAVSIPDSVHTIGDSAFRSSGVTTCFLPTNLSYLGDSAFRDSKLTQTSIPDKLTAIPQYTFSGCKNLTKVTMSNNVNTIGNNAFDGCTTMNQCLMPSKLSEVGDYAFRNCRSITGALDFPSSTVRVGTRAFQATGYTSVKMQANLTNLGVGAFEDCTQITTATLSDKITSIPQSLFEDCTAMTAVNISKNTTVIGARAFMNCSKLSNFKMPEKITNIETQAFYKCKSIIDVGFPKTLRVIQDDAFMYCTGLLDVAFSKDTASLSLSAMGHLDSAPQNGYSTEIEFLFLERGFKHTPVPAEKWGAINAQIVWVDDIDERWVGNITYNLNKGTAVGNPTRYKVTDTIVLNNPTRQGYDFVGWTGSNGTTKQMTVTINRGTTGDLNYTANYTPRSDTKYTIRYFQMDVFGVYPATPTSTEIKQGVTDSTLTLSSVGKTFTGFTYDHALIDSANATTTTILPDGSRVIDLYYSRNKYSVDVNGYVDGVHINTGMPGRFDVWINGKLESSQVSDFWRENSVYYGSHVIVKSVANEGYRCLDPEMEGYVTTSGCSLSPRFVTNTYTIKFHGGGATSGTMADITIKYNESLSLPANKFVRPGYSFIGWGLTSDGGVNYVDGATVEKLSSSLDGVVNLYAKWSARSSDLMEASKFNAAIPNDVTEVRFVTTAAPSGVVVTDVSDKQDGGVVAWKSGTTWFVSSQRSDTAINAISCARMFKNKTKLQKITFYNLNAAHVDSFDEMFSGCSALTSVNAYALDFSNVTTIKNMFRDCSALTTLNLTGINTEALEDASFAFFGCSSITSLDLSTWKTDSLKNMSYMFRGMSNLTSINVGAWNTSNVTNMEGVFYQCKKLATIDLSNWNTAKVTNMRTMFAHCNALTNAPVGKFNTANNTRFDFMFEGCSSLTSLNLSHFNTDKAINMNAMFIECSKLQTLDISSFNTANLTNVTIGDGVYSPMGRMFQNTIKLETITIGNKFRWIGNDGYLVAPTAANIAGANGKWYDRATADAYTPSELAAIARTETKVYSAAPYYWLDIVNGIKNGVYTDTIQGLGTVDVYIDGKLVADNVTDWYKAYKYGTSFELKDIQSTSNAMYQGFRPATAGDTIKGTLTHDTVGWHVFDNSANVFNYTGSVQSFTAPSTGYYLVEVWGAQGGPSLADGKIMGTGARGGYSKGNVYLQAGETIYIAVGGQGATPTSGSTPAGGWNGGGKGMHDHSDDEVGGAGGGATSIVKGTKRGDGQLYNYEYNKSEVIIVAGGGAGSIWQSTTGGGVGGGLTGGLGTGSSGVTAATQSNGYRFGKGEDGYWDSSWGANQAADGMSGGGGGWYGGNASRQHDNYASIAGDTGCAGGGSSYIDGVVNGVTTPGVNLGNGKAKISYSGTSASAMPSTQEFEFTGSEQVFTVPVSGYYQLEVWGAEGGMGYNSYNLPGLGGYTSGITYLSQGTKLYVYVGEDGIDQFQRGGTFNGGGEGQDPNSYVHIGGRGGGATDIRLVGGAWNNAAGLQSRIIVAGGGGGAQSSCGRKATEGHGGGLIGGSSINMNYVSGLTWEESRTRAYSLGGGQAYGGAGYNINDGQTARVGSGGFGYGAASVVCGAGGGGGYYGGGTGYTSGGGGGSSYVTGYPGCDTTYRSKQGGYNFTGVVMTMGTNSGNGKAKISFIGQEVASQPYKLSITMTKNDVGSFDLYINNELVANDAHEWIGYVPAGSTYQVKDIKSAYKRDISQNWEYICAESPGFSGTVTGDTSRTLRWTVIQVGSKSNAEQYGSNEFTQTTFDLAPLIDKYGTGKYIVHFDAYSPVAGGPCWVYMQNGSESKYKMMGTFQVTTSWDDYYFVLDVTKGENVAASMLAFYGEYGTGRIIHVKDIKVSKVP